MCGAGAGRRAVGRLGAQWAGRRGPYKAEECAQRGGAGCTLAQPYLALTHWPAAGASSLSRQGR